MSEVFWLKKKSINYFWLSRRRVSRGIPCWYESISPGIIKLCNFLDSSMRSYNAISSVNKRSDLFILLRVPLQITDQIIIQEGQVLQMPPTKFQIILQSWI